MKFFYTDPLKVAWMAENFDMRFIHRQDKEQNLLKPYVMYSHFCREYYIDLHNIIGLETDDVHFHVEKGEKLYVHPDCHEMLKPKSADKDEDGYLWMPCRNLWINPLIVINWITGKTTEHVRQESFTSKRNGIAFFMPEIKR